MKMRTTCQVDDCDVEACKRGYCDRHYRRYMKYGNATEPNKIRAGLPRTETCTIEGCEQPGHAAQLCKRHYRNLNLYGEPQTYKREPTGTPRPSGQNLAEAFAYHQEGKPPRPNECWEWRGYRTPDGYGRFVFEMKNIPAHRAAYQVYNGPIPNGMVIRHTCDTPPCVNPAHLLVGKPATPPPEAALIRRLREERGLGRARAASLMGYSEGWWRQVEVGYRRLSNGTPIPVIADDEQLAKMALVVGATEADLRYAKRGDAADRLTEARERRDQIAAPRMEDSDFGDWVNEITEVQLAQEGLPEDRRVAILETRARFKGYEDAVRVRLDDPLVSEEYAENENGSRYEA